MAVTAVPTWFGAEDESLFGCCHLPADGRVRGAVLICPPLAQEVTRTQAALRALAVSLAERGLLALRFDYLGTGDSAGDSAAPGAVGRWLSSIVEAHDFLVGAGVEQIGIVGLRTGALLASNALGRLPGLAALGLWDPTLSGRRFIRQEQALYSVSVHPSERGSEGGVVEGVGITFDAELQADLRRLTLAEPDPAQVRHTAVFRSAATAAGTDLAGAECITIPDAYEDGPSDVSFFAGRLPVTAIRLITGWVDARMPVDVGDQPVTIRTRDVATMDTPSGAVRETLVAIPRDPAPGVLHSVLSEPVDGAEAARARPAALILNISVTGRTGPTRGWVTSARRIAAAGTVAVRLDRYGIGESIDDSAGYVARDFHDDALLDVALAARFARPEDPSNVQLAGLCSGAWAAATVARDLKPRKIVLMNMNLLAWTPVTLDDEHARSTGVAWVLDPNPHRPPSRVATLVQWVQDRWRRLPLGLAVALRLVHRPARLLHALPLDTTRVTLMLCDEDFTDFVDLDGLDALRNESSDAAVQLTSVYYADHGLIGRRGRERMLDEMVTELTSG